jgi:hypothetical protein
MVSHCNKIQFIDSYGNDLKIKLKVKKIKLEEHKFDSKLGMINCFRHALMFLL